MANKNGSHFTATKKVANSKQVLLVYTGSIAGLSNVDIGIRIEMDTSIGIRYEATLENGATVISHVAIFYKFSKPTETITYNYRNHSRTISECCGSPARDPQVLVIGMETVDSFSCTHLRHTVKSNYFTEVADYWVSTKLPGFQQLANVLNTLKSTIPMMTINGTVFERGGLVKMTTTYSDEKHGTRQSTLRLTAANADIQLPAKDFDVPTN
jgi:hypothetical protein